MYISLKWVQDLIGVQKLTLNDLVNRLTLTGFEIESINSKKYLEQKDIILDISITANRADVSNIKGLINEISTLFSTKVFFPSTNNIKPLILKTSQIDVDNLISNKKLFPKNRNYDSLVNSTNYKFFSTYKIWQSNYYLWEWYLQKKAFSKFNKTSWKFNFNQCDAKNYIGIDTLKAQNISIKDSPYWIKKRLMVMGVTPINNIIDTLHYLMIETGQVIFAYDVDSLKKLTETENLTFVPMYATNQCTFSLSNTKTIPLTTDILTLTINNKIISLAGLIQNYKTIITNETSSILLQVALFNPKQVKKSSKILGLRTDYSIKLEKETDLNLLEQALLRLKHLFWLQNIKLYDLSNENNETIQIPENNFSLFSSYMQKSDHMIKIFYQDIKKLTGPSNNTQDLNNSHLLKILKLLNFKIYFQTENSCYISIPLARQSDIDREIDIIEEIVRVIGFNNFRAVLNYTKKSKTGYLTKQEKFKRGLRNYFLSLGFNESIHETLTKSNSTNEIQLKNPISNESSILRLNLLDGLIEKVKFNQKNIGNAFESFELGRIYKKLGNGRQKEIEVISGVFGGKIFRSNWDNESSSLSWFEAKGFLEIFFEKLNIHHLVSWQSSNNCLAKFHPNLTADLFIGNQKLGIFGQLHPNFALKNGLKNKLYCFEFNIEILNSFSIKNNLITYNQYSYYPISYVDLSFLVKKVIAAEEIRQVIYKFGQPLLKNITIVDYYYKKPIKDEYCSLTFKLKFQSETRTLSNDEVLQIINPIIDYLERHYDVKIQE